MTGHLPDGEPGVDVWGDPGWRASATAWLDDQLRAAGQERTGEVTQPHLRPWATVLSAPTTMGRVWLKAMAPGTIFEVGLYELLVRVAPGNVLTPIASDSTRGWILLPDGGPSLADRLTGSDLLEPGSRERGPGHCAADNRDLLRLGGLGGRSPFRKCGRVRLEGAEDVAKDPRPSGCSSDA